MTAFILALCSCTEQILDDPNSLSCARDRSSILRGLRLLEASPTLTQGEMARDTGMSLGKANYYLRELLSGYS